MIFFYIIFLFFFIRDGFKKADLVPEKNDPQNEEINNLPIFIFKDENNEPVEYVSVDEYMQFSKHEAIELSKQHPNWKIKELNAKGWINAKEYFHEPTR